MWEGKERFPSVKELAANIATGERGTYTVGMFLEDFPQFTKIPDMDQADETVLESLVPEHILQMFVDQVNDSVLPSRWGSMWRYAAGLYVAHISSMYLKTYTPGSGNAGEVAGGAQQVGNVKSSSMGQTSVSYDNSAITAGMEKWGVWNATQYGSQLVTMARMVGMGGMYVI